MELLNNTWTTLLLLLTSPLGHGWWDLILKLIPFVIFLELPVYVVILLARLYPEKSGVVPGESDGISPGHAKRWMRVLFLDTGVGIVGNIITTLMMCLLAYATLHPQGILPQGWTIAGRETVSQIDGLLHLSLDPEGYRADGLSIRLEDFELSFESGSLFTSPPALGPTALVFVGAGTVRFRPAPEAEREQLRQFAGKRELVERVRGAFIRIHPGDFRKVLAPARLDPDPQSARRLSSAQRIFRQQASNAFVLDAPIPGSPWWLMPSLGDASLTFEAGNRGTLTLLTRRLAAM